MKEISNGIVQKVQESIQLPNQIETDGKLCSSRINVPPEEDYSVNALDIFLTVISMILRLFSIFLNFLLAVEYFRINKWNYFVWTSCCIVIPMILTTLLCIHMYVYDRKRMTRKNCIKFLWFVVFCPLLFRYYKSLQFAVKSKISKNKNDIDKQKHYYRYMVEEESDVALIRIFESSLEAAPQKILQISIYLAGEDKMTWIQLFAICGCLGSLTWCIVVYHKYNRVTQPDKEKISPVGIIFQILWNFCIYVSRILCIATVASVFPVWTLLACCAHALLMSLVTLFIERPTFCSNTIFHRVIFSLAIGIVFIFTYLTLKDVRTRYRYALYYTLCAIENLACIMLFAQYATGSFRDSRLFIPLCIISFFTFFIGIIFMILYYKRFHPNIIARNLVASSS